jgi:hypothetical protein
MTLKSTGTGTCCFRYLREEIAPWPFDGDKTNGATAVVRVVSRVVVTEDVVKVMSRAREGLELNRQKPGS